MDDKLKRVAEKLLEQPKSFSFWPWLDDFKGKPVDKKAANKFLLGCIIDYQIDADQAWGNARRLAEQTLGDPQDLWRTITREPLSKWMKKWRQYALHRFPKAHERVWRIGSEIVDRYDGDGRNIWKGQSPEIVLDRLNGLRMGQQISRMVVGGLLTTNQISGIGDVKADIHIKKVVGRVFYGCEASEEEATWLTRQMHPENPWLLNEPLFLLGKRICYKSNPSCKSCYLRSDCSFFQRT